MTVWFEDVQLVEPVFIEIIMVLPGWVYNLLEETVRATMCVTRKHQQRPAAAAATFAIRSANGRLQFARYEI